MQYEEWFDKKASKVSEYNYRSWQQDQYCGICLSKTDISFAILNNNCQVDIVIL